MYTNQAIHIDAETEQAVRQVIVNLGTAFNSHDSGALSTHVAEDAAWTTVTGKMLFGRESVAVFGKSVMPMLEDKYTNYEIVNMLALAPKVIAVRVRQTPTDASGHIVDGSRAIGLYVVALTEQGWKIVAGQVTFVVE